MSEPWRCPQEGCLKVIRESGEAYLRVAIASHMKTHGRRASGRPAAPAPAPARKKESEGLMDTVAEVVGHAVGGAIGALGRLLD